MTTPPAATHTHTQSRHACRVVHLDDRVLPHDRGGTHDHYQTGPSDQRPRRDAHLLSGRGLVFRITEEVDSLRNDLEHTSGGRAAKTLANVRLKDCASRWSSSKRVSN